MDDEWDSENFAPKLPPSAGANKWEGEDEDLSVKDSWDADDEEKQPDASSKTAQIKKKNKLGEKLEEKRKLEEAGKSLADMTPEEAQAEKLRRQKLQEESDLEVAKDMLGIKDVPVDHLKPVTKEDFVVFEEAIRSKILSHRHSDHFPYFAEELIRNLCVNLNTTELKKLKITVESLHAEKSKVEKASEKTKKSKGKAKARLRMEGDNVNKMYDEFSAYTVEDFDDFM